MHTLAALSWDPQLRGVLIVMTAFGILVGSSYLLLATNVGAKVGFLLAAAGLAGWLFLLNLVWLGYGIGYKGAQPTWKVKEIVTGDLVTHATTKTVVGKPAFPHGWRFLPPGNPILAPAAPVADKALIPPAPGAKPGSSFPPPFSTTQDYVPVSAWDKGGHNYLVNLFGYKVYWRIRHHQMYIKHQPHYLVIRVQPSLPSVTLAGSAATLPAGDVSKPVTSVVMLRNVGSLRKPPAALGLASLIVFLLMCERLHAREREIARLKEHDADAKKPGRELQPA